MHQVLAVSRDTANTIDGIIPLVAGLALLGFGLFGKDGRTKAPFAGRMKLVLVGGGALVAVGAIVRLVT